MRERLKEEPAIEKGRILTKEEEVGLAKLLEVGRAARVKLANNPEVCGTERSKLTEQIRNGFAARANLIVSNLGLVGGITRSYLNRGMGYKDVFQNGSLGLIRAVDKFDYRRGHRLSTLAFWWINAQITDGFKKYKDKDDNDEFPLSLNEPARSEDGKMAPLGEVIADTSAKPLDELVAEQSLKEAVLVACEELLGPEEKEVVYQRFDINQQNVLLEPGRRFVMHNSKAPVLAKALASIKASPYADVLLAYLR